MLSDREQQALREVQASSPRAPASAALSAGAGRGRTLERRSRPAEALVHYRMATAMSDHPDYRDRLELVAARLDSTPAAATG